ncbi:sulfotransferase family 2 domain-containing protein [Cytobacillus purgationiresistens]|uniref:Sulfotransferase family protein n=1 Tax=Cytobacillus purgationiresistens TaxID=863449 RepID=A0ABU0AG05_9BACI|nr:sulfotransferase family 2 domain-containing protein [Cytobacillus purgationiresistens]MDQ0269722.1 hypothetical protein [Cytobacillus purgationiresistens]
MSDTNKIAAMTTILNPSYIPLHNHDFPLILLWSPKSACTTMNRWFFYQIGLLQDVATESGGEVHSYRDYVYRKDPEYTEALKLDLLQGKKDIIKVVRNPYKRAVSSYLHTLAAPWLIHYFNRKIEEGLSFKQFLIELKEMGPQFMTIDRHIGQQYITGEELFNIQYIKIDDLNNQIRRVEKEYGLLKSPLYRLSGSSHHFSKKMKREGNYADQILNIDAFSNLLPKMNSFYNAETKKLVEDLYATDFLLYGYDKEL